MKKKDPPSTPEMEENEQQFWGELAEVVDKIQEGTLTKRDRLGETWKNIIQQEKTGETKLNLKRAAKVKQMLEWEQELQDRQKQLMQKCPPHVQKVLKSGGRERNLAMIEQMLRETQHPDKNLLKEIMGGFSVTGILHDVGLYTRLEKVQEIQQTLGKEETKRHHKPGKWDDELLQQLEN